jgi:mRNA interferase MazF
MVEEKINLTHGGIYLAKLNPSKKNEIGKVRPVIVLTAEIILNISPPTVFVCPLSSKSFPEFESLHVKLTPRDGLEVNSFALVEHCRSISTQRLILPRLAQLNPSEIYLILSKLQRMLGITRADPY